MWLSLLLTSELTAAQSLQDRIDYGTDWWFWIDDVPVGQFYPAYITLNEETGENDIAFFTTDAKETLDAETRSWGTVEFDGVDDDGNALLSAINFGNGDVFLPGLTDDLGFGDNEPTDAIQKYTKREGFFFATNYYIWQFASQDAIDSPFITEDPNFDPASVLNIEISEWNDNQIQ